MYAIFLSYLKLIQCLNFLKKNPKTDWSLSKLKSNEGILNSLLSLLIWEEIHHLETQDRKMRYSSKHQSVFDWPLNELLEAFAELSIRLPKVNSLMRVLSIQLIAGALFKLTMVKNLVSPVLIFYSFDNSHFSPGYHPIFANLF